MNAPHTRSSTTAGKPAQLAYWAKASRACQLSDLFRFGTGELPSLDGKELLVSLALEGQLQVEGLQSMEEEDDVLTAIARELVTRQGVGEQAAEIWRAMTRAQPANSRSLHS